VHHLDDVPTAAGLFDRTGLDLLVAPSPMWPWLVIAAALLLPIDVATRRLVLRRETSSVRVSTPTGHAQSSTSHGVAAQSAATAQRRVASASLPEVPKGASSDQAIDNAEASDSTSAMERLRRAREEGRGESEDLS
jgi:hypothetical protein